MFLFRLPKIEQSCDIFSRHEGVRQIIKLSFISTRGSEKLNSNIRSTSARLRFATVNFVRYSINWETKPPQFVRKQCSPSFVITSQVVQDIRSSKHWNFDILRLCLRWEFSMQDLNSWKAGNDCHCKIIRNTLVNKQDRRKCCLCYSLAQLICFDLLV